MSKVHYLWPWVLDWLGCLRLVLPGLINPTIEILIGSILNCTRVLLPNEMWDWLHKDMFAKLVDIFDHYKSCNDRTCSNCFDVWLPGLVKYHRLIAFADFSQTEFPLGFGSLESSLHFAEEWIESSKCRFRRSEWLSVVLLIAYLLCSTHPARFLRPTQP